MEGIYYSSDQPEVGDGTHLEQFLDFFRPATDVDRQLLKAFVLTLFWGGPPGSRPIFVITSDDGRGAGKSKAAQLIASLAGGYLDVSAKEEISQLKKRLLSDVGQEMRVAIGDNFKSHRLSWAELESLVTSPVISERKLYGGESQRLNLITWCITLNGVGLATDLAQRSAVIKLARGANVGAWEDQVRDFLEKHRGKIVADTIGLLRMPSQPLEGHSRWASWEDSVLSKLEEPSRIQGVIRDRQAAADSEQDELEIIDEYFGNRLYQLGYDPTRAYVRIPNAVAAIWYGIAIGERTSTAKATRRLKQAAAEGQSTGQFIRIQPDPSRSYGRGFHWIGELVDQDAFLSHDLEIRIAEEKKQQESSARNSSYSY